MAIDREKFREGEGAGTFRKEIRKIMIDFLSKKPDRVYTFLDLDSKIGIRIPGGIAFSIYLLSALDDLIEEKKIISGRIGKKVYYAIALSCGRRKVTFYIMLMDDIAHIRRMAMENNEFFCHALPDQCRKPMQRFRLYYAKLPFLSLRPV